MRDWLVNLPEELTESDLIDMVEGTLPAAREPVAIAALKAEPRLGLLIKQMRMDKASLIGIQPEHAPEALADSVLAAIDAQVLRTLAAEAQENSAGIPINSITIDEGPQARAVFESRLFRFTALAAMVVLVGGGFMAYLVHELSSGKKTSIAVVPRPSGPSMIDEDGKSDIAAAPSDAGGSNAAIADASPAHAKDSNASVTQPTEAPALSISIARSVSSPPSATTPARTSDPAPVPPPSPTAVAVAAEPQLSAPSAARFAREGRLTVVVRPKDVGVAIKRLEALARAGAQSPSISQRELVWRALDVDRLPAQYASLAIPSAPSPADQMQGESSTPATLAGSTNGEGQTSNPDAGASSAPPMPTSRPGVKAIYLVGIEPTERGLGELAKAIGEPVQVQTFRLLQTPLVDEISMDPESILWWTVSPSRWAKPALVPVVIEGRE